MEVNILNNIPGISLIINGFLIFLSFLYSIFAVIVVKQTKMLNKGFNTDAAAFLQWLSILHLMASLGVLSISIVFLIT